MNQTFKELQKRVLELEKLNRRQAVKMWELAEEKIDLAHEVERLMRKEESLNVKNKEEKLNQRKRVHFCCK